MNEIRTLLEKYWICKSSDKEVYYKVKRDIPKFQRFVREQLGWKLINNERLLKLEKIPARAESFMGIREFGEIRDYCILCTVLMFLEDKEEQEQFLLSELIDFVGIQLKGVLEVDWTSFSQRKSLVRVLQYMENLHMLQVYEGSSEAFGQEEGQEVLYENTGYSRYFATSFPFDISGYKSYRDFEQEQIAEIETDRGHFRVNRVYRQLAVCPAYYWSSAEDSDSLYLKNQRQWVSRYMEENLGGRLDIHKNAAFWMLDEEDTYGLVHPRDAMLSELVLLLCTQISEAVRQGEFKREEDECFWIEETQFFDWIRECRNRWQTAWSKEYREMEWEKLVQTIEGYMENWMLLRREGKQLCVYPAVGKLTGFYPADYEPKEE
ncbi:MAG: TIGR02678 family protein [bacterium]|nr:TIGR02678 family protein [bacterium]